MPDDIRPGRCPACRGRTFEFAVEERPDGPVTEVRCIDCGYFVTNIYTLSHEPGDYELPVGRYAGKRLSDIPEDYIDWLRREGDRPMIRELARRFLRRWEARGRAAVGGEGRWPGKDDGAIDPDDDWRGDGYDDLDRTSREERVYDDGLS